MRVWFCQLQGGVKGSPGVVQGRLGGFAASDTNNGVISDLPCQAAAGPSAREH